jgi:CDP-diacylglycerol--glycerol-3-phosphate 3-phosphatidyltransferase
VRDNDGPSWPAGIVFAVAAATDQLDGWLARRWRVESAFGKVADPLADRLMIDVCVVLLVAYDRLPWVALVILARDLLLAGGYKFVVPRGYEFEVSQLGKIATWGLYASLGLVLVTERDTWWPLACFWISLGLAVLAAVQYVAKARREVGTGRDEPPHGES